VSAYDLTCRARRGSQDKGLTSADEVESVFESVAGPLIESTSQWCRSRSRIPVPALAKDAAEMKEARRRLHGLDPFTH
jgi:hypothetical protein